MNTSSVPDSLSLAGSRTNCPGADKGKASVTGGDPIWREKAEGAFGSLRQPAAAMG